MFNNNNSFGGYNSNTFNPARQNLQTGNIAGLNKGPSSVAGINKQPTSIGGNVERISHPLFCPGRFLIRPNLETCRPFLNTKEILKYNVYRRGKPLKAIFLF